MEGFVTSFEEIGREKGQLQERRHLVLHQLERKVGWLSGAIQAQITALTAEQLLRLSEALHDFTCMADRTTWLAAQVPASGA